MDQLYENCGVFASFLGTLLEGEFLFLTSIISAKLGYFNYFLGLIAAFFGAYLKDLIKFVIIKKKGVEMLSTRPKLQAKLDRTSQWFEKKPYLYLSLYRLMYGFGSVILMLSGLKDISMSRFAIHSAISVGLWIVVIGGFGYFCAELMLEKLKFISEHKLAFIATLTLLGLLYWFFIKRPLEKCCYVIEDTITKKN